VESSRGQDQLVAIGLGISEREPEICFSGAAPWTSEPTTCAYIPHQELDDHLSQFPVPGCGIHADIRWCLGFAGTLVDPDVCHSSVLAASRDVSLLRGQCGFPGNTQKTRGSCDIDTSP
jgi:hypothetical protein